VHPVDMDEIVVLITAGSETEATNIARALVEQKLVACVNVLPGVRSIFQWKGKVTEEREFLLVAKTVSQAFEQVATTVKSLHSYDVPEVIALPIRHGLPEYLSWVRDVTKQASQSA
jgi:periplasmic divalent cation tolerance protein